MEATTTSSNALSPPCFLMADLCQEWPQWTHINDHRGPNITSSQFHGGFAKQEGGGELKKDDASGFLCFKDFSEGAIL